MTMFLVCAFLFITSFKVTYGDLSDDYLSWADRSCIIEQNLDKKMILQAFGEGFILEEGNPVINDFVECTYKKTAYMNNDGSLNFKTIRSWAVQFFSALNIRRAVSDKFLIVDNAITECETIKGVNPGDTGVKVFNCLIRFIKESANTSNNISER